MFRRRQGDEQVFAADAGNGAPVSGKGIGRNGSHHAEKYDESKRRRRVFHLLCGSTESRKWAAIVTLWLAGALVIALWLGWVPFRYFTLAPEQREALLAAKSQTQRLASDTGRPRFALAVMMKNEEDVILRTLRSVEEWAHKVKLFDTGSTDTTLYLCKEWGRVTGVPVDILQKPFVDYSTSRNRVMDWVSADPDIDFYIFFDANDELQGGEELAAALRQEYASTTYEKRLKYGAYFLNQHLWTSTGTMDYLRVRIFVPHAQWRFFGKIHEYVESLDDTTEAKDLLLDPTKVRAYQNRALDTHKSLKRMPRDREMLLSELANVRAYQNRALDTHKSLKRMPRDREMLLSELAENPNNTRAMFYLAQTCQDLGSIEESIFYYKLRAQASEGYDEEQFVSMQRIAVMMQVTDRIQESIEWHGNALAFFPHRVEPMLDLARIYVQHGDYVNAHVYTSLALKQVYPENDLLFVDRESYEYTRYHLHCIVAYYVDDVSGGVNACNEAIKARNREVDKANSEYYRRLFSVRKTGA